MYILTFVSFSLKRARTNTPQIYGKKQRGSRRHVHKGCVHIYIYILKRTSSCIFWLFFHFLWKELPGIHPKICQKNGGDQDVTFTKGACVNTHIYVYIYVLSYVQFCFCFIFSEKGPHEYPQNTSTKRRGSRRHVHKGCVRKYAYIHI